MLPCRYRAACPSARFERAALGKTTIPPLPCSGPSPPRTRQNREAAWWPMYRHRRRRHEIDAADCVGAHAELTCRGIDEAFEQICGLGPPSAAIGTDRHRVCAHPLDVDVDRLNRIETRDEICRACRDEAAKRR